MAEHDLLARLGQIVMTEVRDEAIEKYEMIVGGRIKSERALGLTNKLGEFSDNQLEIIRNVVVNAIDDVLHNFLWMLEQHVGEVRLLVFEEQASSGKDAVALSDGLSGEAYTEDGWINRFSKYKENY